MTDVEKQPGWKRGVKIALRRVGFICIPVILWILVGKLGFFDSSVFEAGLLVLGASLFIFGFPLSLVVGIDQLQTSFGIRDNLLTLGIALLIVLVNFVLIGAIVGHKRRNNPPKKRKSKKSDTTELAVSE